MKTATHTVTESGVDYISLSLPLGAHNYEIWRQRCRNAMELVGDAGNLLKPGSFNGYDGFYCGGSFFGERDDGSHLHIPGSWADRLFVNTYHNEAHYSRIDVQATVRFEKFDLKLAVKEERRANAHNDSLQKNRQRKIRLIRDNCDGRTLYIGVRTSPVYCRLYNKSAKSPGDEYASCWRYEVELHNDIATEVAGRVFAQKGAIATYCASLVWQTFKARGIPPPYSKEVERAALPPHVQPTTDFSRKLTWLREQVRPSVRSLLENVPRDIVIEALGLADDLPVEP